METQRLHAAGCALSAMVDLTTSAGGRTENHVAYSGYSYRLNAAHAFPLDAPSAVRRGARPTGPEPRRRHGTIARRRAARARRWRPRSSSAVRQGPGWELDRSPNQRPAAAP